MRAPFIRELVAIAEQDERIVLLTGDLGFMVIEPFSDRFPDRFFNVGIAEQNLVGVATGLAEAGYVPFVYSIATFATLRPYEFIRNGPVGHRLPVRIVGIGGGFDYGSAGSTHHSVEDLGVMRLLDGLTVLAPGDHEQAVTALRATYDLPGPVYYRLGKDEKRTVSRLDGAFRLGRAETVRRGEDVALIATGAIAVEAAEAADLLVTAGIDATVIVVGCIDPAPTDDLLDALSSVDVAVTVEAHSRTGGLGSLVAEIVTSAGLGCWVQRLGIERSNGRNGSDAFLLDRGGLSPASIAATVVEALATSRGD